MAMLAAKKAAITRTSLSDAVYQQVVDAILDGSLAAGQELSEVALAADLGVSRTPVHEAVRRLAADGLVEIDALRQARIARFSRAEIVEIYEMRMCLEPAAAERAASRIDASALTELHEAADALAAAQTSRGWSARAIDFDVRFHEMLAEACGNGRLRAEIVKYRRLVRAFCRMSASAENLREALAEHRRILNALQAGDGRAARRAMTAHILARLAAVLRGIDAAAESSPQTRNHRFRPSIE